MFSQILFDRKRKNPSKLCKAFAGLFPVLYGKIEAIKSEDYHLVSRMLQSSEAEIMLGGVVRHIAETSKIPVLTIHDSILCFEEHKDYVKQLIENAFAETLGVCPKLKFKENRPDTSEVVQVPPPKSVAVLKRENEGNRFHGKARPPEIFNRVSDAKPLSGSEPPVIVSDAQRSFAE